jgi:hypothetical protein
MTRECNAKHATAMIAASFEAHGGKTSVDYIEAQPLDAQTIYHSYKSTASSYVLSEALPAQSVMVTDTLDSMFTGTVTRKERNWLDNNAHKVRSGLTQALRPSEIFPKSVTEPLLAYVDKHASVYAEKGAKGKAEYVKGITAIANKVSFKGMDELYVGELKHWLTDLKEGYPYYDNASPNILAKGVNNVISNTLTGSTNIIGGNVIEGLVKGPAFYGKNFFGEILNRDNYKKNPELEKRGVYGHYLDEGRTPKNGVVAGYSKIIDELNGFTDVALKNMAYESGKKRSGTHDGGMKAIEDIAFKSRLGNESRVQRSPATRSWLTLANYTMSQYSMLSRTILSVARGARNGEDLSQSGRS